MTCIPYCYVSSRMIQCANHGIILHGRKEGLRTRIELRRDKLMELQLADVKHLFHSQTTRKRRRVSNKHTGRKTTKNNTVVNPFTDLLKQQNRKLARTNKKLFSRPPLHSRRYLGQVHVGSKASKSRILKRLASIIQQACDSVGERNNPVSDEPSGCTLIELKGHWMSHVCVAIACFVRDIWLSLGNKLDIEIANHQMIKDEPITDERLLVENIRWLISTIQGPHHGRMRNDLSTAYDALLMAVVGHDDATTRRLAKLVHVNPRSTALARAAERKAELAAGGTPQLTHIKRKRSDRLEEITAQHIQQFLG